MKTALVQIDNLRLRRSPGFELRIDHLDVRAGSVMCVAGPNGSGKSTLISALAGLLAADHGSLLLAGQPVARDLRSTKAILGYIPDDEDWFIGELSAREYLRLLAEIYADAGGPAAPESAARAHALAESLYFAAFDQQLNSLSHGNKKKVQIIAGLMHEPKVVVVDEVRNGLDPLAIIAAEQLVKDAAIGGAAVVAATHDLWWAERVAGEIVLLADGQVAVHSPTKLIQKQYGSVERLFLERVALERQAVHAGH